MAGIGGVGEFPRQGVTGRRVKQAPATEELFAPRMVGRGQDGGAELGAAGRCGAGQGRRKYPVVQDAMVAGLWY